MPSLHLALLFSALLGSSAFASDPAIASPREFLGYELGARFTPHHRIVAYAEHVAERSPRLKLQRYGETKGGRPLLLLLATSPEHHARLHEWNRMREKLGDARLHAEEEASALAATMPAVVWLSYNVHGNEASPGETVMQVLHRLATAEDEETLRWLSELIMVIDPCVNPDGRDRYVHWFQDTLGKSPDAEPQALEHDEPWPGGRGNGELFDLNRDWAFATQVETRARLKHFVPMRPQVHVDFHEMGFENGYFFFPAEKPINANLEAHTLHWGEVFGRGNAAAFDARGWQWYSAEDFDLFYPGYGDSWPSFGGAIGMTYEQGGGSSAGSVVRRRDLSTLSLAQRLEAHAVSSYATLETAAKHRQELLLSWASFRRRAMTEGRTQSPRCFVLPEAPDPGRAFELVALLRLQGIEVERLAEEWIPERARDTAGREQLFPHFPRGTYLVRLHQPLKRLVKTLLETEVKVDEARFYDVSAWCLPLAFGVPCYATESDVPESTRVAPTDDPRSGGVSEGEATVGWLLSYTTHDALRALCGALDAGLRVRSATKNFTLDGRAWERGTILVRRSENAPTIREQLEILGTQYSVRFEAVSSGFSEKGIDLGSLAMRPVRAPKIALLGGSGVPSTSFGATRFVLERGLGLRVSSLPFENLATLDLKDFTAVVVPGARLQASAIATLRAYAQQGGTVIAIGRSAYAFAEGPDGVRMIATPALPANSTPQWIEAREQSDREREQPGSIFAIDLDPTHPLAFGASGGVATLHVGDRAFDATGPGLHAARFSREAPLSGYVPSAADAALRGAAFVTIEELGAGRIVLFASDPNFRGVWHGLTRVFANALLLLPTPR